MAKKKKSDSKSASSLLYFINKEKVKAFDDGRLLDEKNDSYTCAIAQTLFAAGNDGLGFEALVKAVGKIVKHKNEKTLRLSTRWYLSSKRSDVAKFVTSKREEIEDSPKRAKSAKSAANGAAKPRKRKAKAAKKRTGSEKSYAQEYNGQIDKGDLNDATDAA